MTIIYPVGDASFSSIRTDGAKYVDKTDLVYRLAREGRFYFLSRPRRFGKSLLVSTLEAYFTAQRELFDGLAMEQLEKEWVTYPVLRIDFAQEAYSTPGVLETVIGSMLTDWETLYGESIGDQTLATRFKGVIRRAHAKTEQRVVVLVDEYDKPMLDAWGNEKLMGRNQEILRRFYGVLKGSIEHLRFVFLTGITKFAHLNVFSGLNNLRDISMEQQYATLCGISEKELQDNFAQGVAQLASINNQTIEEAYAKLKERYDGYCFTSYSTERLYNPFSLINALAAKAYDSYWYATGTASFLYRMVLDRYKPLEQLTDVGMRESELWGREPDKIGLVPLLYQTGYLTIDSYDPARRRYTLRFPNQEVWEAFYDGLEECFFKRDDSLGLSVDEFYECIMDGEVETLMANMYTFLAGSDYRIAGDREVYFQNAMVIIFRLLGFMTHAEYATSNGRIDAVVETPKYIYLFEFKYGHSAQEAMAQIEEKKYAARYAQDTRQLFKLGVGFSKETCTIEDCIIRREGEEDLRMCVRGGKLVAVGS